MSIIMMPAGVYFVGDPRFCFNEEGWRAVHDASNAFGESHFTLKEQEMWMAGTAYGDGDYLGSDGYEYPVRSGLIGVVPVFLVEGDDIQMFNLTNGEGRRGTMLIADDSFEVDTDGTVIFIGGLEIDTDPEEEPDEFHCECGIEIDEDEISCDDCAEADDLDYIYGEDDEF